jgi:basic membrane protein A
MMKNKIKMALILLYGIISTLILSSCFGSSYDVMVVVDKLTGKGDSFNQQAVDGIKLAKKNFDIDYEIKEAKDDDDFPNLLKEVDKNTDLVIGIGYKPEESIIKMAQKYPDTEFVMVDCTYDGKLSNVVGISYKVQESSFLVGYIAGMTTKTDKVGFIGGVENSSIIPFEYGYRAGVRYAAAQLDKAIAVKAVYINSFQDSALAQEKAGEMYADDIDIIFQASGSAEIGVINAAKENGKYVIGVDMDQSSLAPGNVLTSALKDVMTTVYDVVDNYKEKTKSTEKTIQLGLYEGGVGIPQENPLVDKDVLKRTFELEDLIINGDIVPPADKGSYEEYIKTLK